MHDNDNKGSISYNEFCAWLGSSIEPTETFFFRHDSKKNPGFEVSFQKGIEKREPNQLKVSGILSLKNLKQ